MIIAQISDLHITEAGQGVDQQFQTIAHLQNAVTHLNNLPAPVDLVIITGDCVDNGTANEYQLLKELLSQLQMPYYIIPGNHDNRVELNRTFGKQGSDQMESFIQYVIETDPVRLIGLDTNVPDQSHGYLCAERLQWLEKQLTNEPSKPTIIFQHHPPFNIGIDILDAMKLTNADEYGEIIARANNVERVLCGHVHRSVQRRYNGTVAITCASTAHQILLDLQHQERLNVVMEPPTCLLHIWQENLGLVTHNNVIK